jgi:hypothetical protein
MPIFTVFSMLGVSAVFLRIRASLWLAGVVQGEKNTLSLRVRHANDQSLQASQEHGFTVPNRGWGHPVISDAETPMGSVYRGRALGRHEIVVDTVDCRHPTIISHGLDHSRVIRNESVPFGFVFAFSSLRLYLCLVADLSTYLRGD